MNKETASKIFAGKRVVTAEGKYIVRVKSTALIKNKTQQIINTNLMTEMQATVYEETTTKEQDVNLQFELNRCQLSFAQPATAEFKPKKGDFIYVVVSKIPVNSGKAVDFRIIGIEELPVITTDATYQELIDGELSTQSMVLADLQDENLSLQSPIETSELINKSSDIDMPI